MSLDPPITQADVDERTAALARDGRTDHISGPSACDRSWPWLLASGVTVSSLGFRYSPDRPDPYDLISRIPKEKPMSQVSVIDERTSEPSCVTFESLAVGSLFELQGAPDIIYRKLRIPNAEQVSDCSTPAIVSVTGNKLCRRRPDLQLVMSLRNA